MRCGGLVVRCGGLVVRCGGLVVSVPATRSARPRFESRPGAHCNYFGPTMGGRVGLLGYFRFLKVALTAHTEDIFVNCLIKTGKNVPFYQNNVC